MLTYWMDVNDPFRAFDAVRRRMDQVFREYDQSAGPRARTSYPRASLRDTHEGFVLTAEVPGLADNDIQISATMDSLTIAGERKSVAPEGYAVHRQERGSLRFARSFALPAKIDVDKVSASVKNGVLTVTMPKHPESQPRAITVKAQ
ncbi:MAG: Hsp20/alpha crystallin family protein [Nannocystis sp.]|nr:Hsp20/alpha crystallin family protein [Nannocystis sp.]MBA3546492.1 Hsp20/alpha crystallin family protein [Nannocystis sp.]